MGRRTLFRDFLSRGVWIGAFKRKMTTNEKWEGRTFREGNRGQGLDNLPWNISLKIDVKICRTRKCLILDERLSKYNFSIYPYDYDRHSTAGISFPPKLWRSDSNCSRQQSLDMEYRRKYKQAILFDYNGRKRHVISNFEFYSSRGKNFYLLFLTRTA